MQALGQCGDADPVRPAGWADLLWWRRADADGQRAGSQGGANASERQRACKGRCPQRRHCPINEPFVYWRSGCEWKRWRRRNGLRGASTWAFGPISITYCAGNGGEAYDEMCKYYNTKNRPVHGAWREGEGNAHLYFPAPSMVGALRFRENVLDRSLGS